MAAATQEEQLVKAVEIASNAAAMPDADLVAQALAYLEQLKQATQESWSIGWAIWTARTDDGSAPKYDHAPRLFGLNLVDDFLDKRIQGVPEAAEVLTLLQESALAYLQSEFVSGQGEQGIPFMKNKLAQTLSLLIVQTYSLTSSYTFLTAMLSMCTAHPMADDKGMNVVSADLAMRVLHDMSLSLGSDVTLRSVRGKERLQRDAIVRDEIRAHHAASLAELLWRVIQDSLHAIQQGADGSASPRHLNAVTAGPLASLAMAVVGDYASWIDIGLVVTMETVQILYSALDAPHMPLRYATADTLCEIVSKGMKPVDKLSLIEGLSLDAVLTQLESTTRGQGEAQTELREHLARLVNALCTELCKIAEDVAGAEAETREAAHSKLLTFLQLVLAFLADEYDEPVEQVLPCLHLVLSLYKKTKRQNETLGLPALGAPLSEFVSQLITLSVQKLKFDADIDWQDSSLVGGAADGDAEESEDDDEQLVRFYELRKQLQVILGAIAAIDESLVSSTIHALVVNTLAAVGSPTDLPWEQAEVCLYAAFSCGEVLSSVRGNKIGLGAHSYVQIPVEPGKSRNVRQALSVYQALPPNALGEILQHLFRSQIGEHPHPVVQLQYFECVVRYATSFVLWPDLLPKALEAFLGPRGLCNPHHGMRRRINYLFYRFVRDTRTAIPPEIVPRLLESMPLAVTATLPEVSADEDPLARATEKASAFDSQLYLFDTSGLLIAQLGHMPDTQVMLFKLITQPLAEQLQQSVQAADPSNLQLVLQVHHLILALSTITKGFPDYDANRAHEPAWIEELKPLTEQILMALTALNRFMIVREAARGAFARIVASAGPAVLPYIPTLIHALVHHVTEAELVDLLNFFGLITNKYKDNVRSVMDNVFGVLVSRIFSFLHQGVQGTDDLVRRSDTERAYFGLVHALLQAGMDDVLVSEKNQAQLEAVLQSHVYYVTHGEPVTQRAAISVLSQLVQLWARPNEKAIMGFEQFVYDAILPLVFQVPAKPSFDSSDAQSQLVLSELAGLLKSLYTARGDEFLQYLSTVYLPSVQCPPELALELTKSVQSLEVKPLKRFLDTFIAQSRGA